MRAFWNGIAVIAVAVLIGIGIAVILEHPPHAEPAAARVTTGLYETALEVHHAIGEIENDAYQQHLAALAAALEAERLAAARRTGTPRAAAPRDLGPECQALSAQLGLPAEIIYRESRCSWSAFNHTGCGGRVGLAHRDVVDHLGEGLVVPEVGHRASGRGSRRAANA
ncbi:MAG: hypothetical protein ACO3ZY_06435, partial [Phycisphaerales bacterium]